MGTLGTKSASSKELFQKELELKQYEERLRLREVAVNEHEKRLDGKLVTMLFLLKILLLCFD